MATADEYRVKAAELSAKAQLEKSGSIRNECFRLVQAYLRLAEQAERNSHTDLVYETPRRPEAAVVQQQQQAQPKK